MKLSKKNLYRCSEYNSGRLLFFQIQSTILFMCFILCAHGATKAAEVSSLQVEYTETPLGIDVQKPRFGWQMIAPENERGYSQTAYRIRVKNPDDALMWDSGKVSSDVSVAVPYKGNTLQATTRYHWSVTVWDQNGNAASESSWFETGSIWFPNSSLGTYLCSKLCFEYYEVY